MQLFGILIKNEIIMCVIKFTLIISESLVKSPISIFCYINIIFF